MVQEIFNQKLIDSGFQEQFNQLLDDLEYRTKKGFTTEIYLGLGRNLGADNSSLEAVGRGGISLGYRF